MGKYGWVLTLGVLCLLTTHCRAAKVLPWPANTPVAPQPGAVRRAPTPALTQAAVLPQDSTLPVATRFYISQNGDNTDGRTWETAWNELDQIDWAAVQPGDVILLDGGAQRMIYETSLVLEKSGSADRPIVIRRATDPARNGRVILHGGRTTLLPYCGQALYQPEEELPLFGIDINKQAHIVIDGGKWGGILVHGFGRSGIRLLPGAQDILVRNLELYNNGAARRGDDGWYPDQPGVQLAGADLTFEQMLIHDNGQDAFQSYWDSEGITNLVLRRSWLYNSRRHPTVDESANYCTHTDGIQIFSGGVQGPLLIEQSIIGPGFTQGVILGQTPTAEGASAVVNNVTIRDVLFAKAADNNILAYPGTEPEGWVVDHVTLHCPKTKGHCLHLAGTNHQITNSIVHGAHIAVAETSALSNNCYWNTTGDVAGDAAGDAANPHFIQVSDIDHFSLDNYAITSASPCAGRGSYITSVYQLRNSQP